MYDKLYQIYYYITKLIYTKFTITVIIYYITEILMFLITKITDFRLHKCQLDKKRIFYDPFLRNYFTLPSLAQDNRNPSCLLQPFSSLDLLVACFLGLVQQKRLHLLFPFP